MDLTNPASVIVLQILELVLKDQNYAKNLYKCMRGKIFFLSCLPLSISLIFRKEVNNFIATVRNFSYLHR